MPELNDLDLDQNLDDEGNDGDGADEAAAESSSEPAKGKDDKRYSDLISARDREVARANKAEAALAKLTAGESGSSGSDDPERKALLEELREASLDAVYGEFSELKDYGIDRSLIEGQTRAEMRESATSLVALVKGVVTKAKNETLREHGIKAEPAGSTRKPPKSYAEMSDEEFEKELARAKSGGSGLTW